VSNLRLGCRIFLAVLFVASAAEARQWTDKSGQFRVEAEVVAVKEGKVYLEKKDGTVVAVPLDRLSSGDVEHLKSLPAYRSQFAAAAAKTASSPSPKPASPPPKMAVIGGFGESKVGEVRRFPEMGWGVRSLAFSPNGKLLAVGKMDRALLVFDVDQAARTARHEKLENLGEVTCMAFTPDGTKLLTGGRQGRIQVWNVAGSGELSEANAFVGHADGVRAIAVCRDGKTVLSSADEGKARCWDLESCRERFAVDGFDSAVKACYLTPGGKQGLACDGQIVALLDMGQGKVLQTMKLGSGLVEAAAIAPDGSSVAVADGYNLRLWEIRSGKEYPMLEDDETQWTVGFLPNSKYVLSGGRAKVNVWHLEKQRKVYEFDTAGKYYVQCLACSPDNRHFAAIPGSAGQELQVFRLPADVAE